VSLVVASAVLMLACGRPDDTEEVVRQTLESSNIRGVTVSVDREPHIVHLSGTVETLADRTRAVELAAAVVGSQGRVRNEIQVDGLGPVGSVTR